MQRYCSTKIIQYTEPKDLTIYKTLQVIRIFTLTEPKQNRHQRNYFFVLIYYINELHFRPKVIAYRT